MAALLDSTPSPSTQKTPLVLVPAADNPSDDWRRDLICFAGGMTPTPDTVNAIHAFTHHPDWKNVLWYDSFRHQYRFDAAPPWDNRGNREWQKADTYAAAAWLQREGIRCRSRIAEEGMITVSVQNKRNPLRDWLDSLEWDRVPRVDTWLHRYLGAPDTRLNRAIGRCWLISAVARAYQPGCQVDHCLVLESKQGLGKSSGIQALVGAEYHAEYSCGRSLTNKDAMIACRGVWVMEFAELVGWQDTKAEDLKSFISRRTDRYRLPFDVQASDLPRQCVFAASTNAETYLDDPTGGRRFWPVKCKYVGVETLKEDRESLWAEAVTAYKAGERWHLDKFMEAEVEKEQAARQDRDIWHNLVADFVAKKKDQVTTETILMDLFSRRKDELNRVEQKRVARILTGLGWTQHKSDGRMQYRPPVKATHRPSLDPDKAKPA